MLIKRVLYILLVSGIMILTLGAVPSRVLMERSHMLRPNLHTVSALEKLVVIDLLCL